MKLALVPFLVLLAAPLGALAQSETATTEAPTETQPAEAQPAEAQPAEAQPAQSPTVEDQNRFRFDLGLTFSRFEQQVKGELGGVRGDRLVEEMAFGLHGVGSFNFWELFSVGLFFQLDAGTRNAARFDGFDAMGATRLRDEVGGGYWEFWFGPLLRVQWRALFFEVGWGAFGIREDDAREDLPGADGSTDGAFQTSPTVAWMFTLGGNIPLYEDLDLVLRMSYRIRYYVSRGGEDLIDEVVHGTQNYTPFVGVAYNL